jgi:hypothetical protein
MLSYCTPLLFQKTIEVGGASLTTGPEFEALVEHWIAWMIRAGSFCFYTFSATVCSFTTPILA